MRNRPFILVPASAFEMEEDNKKRQKLIVDKADQKSYTISQVYEKKNRKYGVEEYTYKAKFSDGLKTQNVIELRDDLYSMFDDIMKKVGDNYDPMDKVRLSIDHAALDKEITIHLQPRQNITAQTIMDR